MGEIELEYEISEVAGFMRDLQESRFATCEQWDATDCNCAHCKIEHYASKLEKALEMLEKK